MVEVGVGRCEEGWVEEWEVGVGRCEEGWVEEWEVVE